MLIKGCGHLGLAQLLISMGEVKKVIGISRLKIHRFPQKTKKVIFFTLKKFAQTQDQVAFGQLRILPDAFLSAPDGFREFSRLQERPCEIKVGGN